MLDWQGLLKFSLKYSDGTKKSQFKEMTAEDKKWLEQAMQQFCNSQIKRIQAILQSLQNFKELQQQNVYGLLQQLQQLLDSLDKGETLYKMNGHIVLLRIIFYSDSIKCREISLQIYSSANQNDAKVQNQSINTGALQMIDLLRKEKNMRLRQNLFSGISATLRGENLEAKRIFIRLNGLQLLQQQSKDASQKLNNKINTLWRDLLYYDDNLHKTHNDLSSFSNTANIKTEKKQHYDLTYDVNQQLQLKNELQQNAKYKGCVKKYMQSNKVLFEGYLKWLKLQISYQN